MSYRGCLVSFSGREGPSWGQGTGDIGGKIALEKMTTGGGEAVPLLKRPNQKGLGKSLRTTPVLNESHLLGGAACRTTDT